MNARNSLRVLIAKAARLIVPASKSVGEDYQAKLDAIVASGKDAQQTERELTALLALIAYLAFQEGMRAGGVTDPEQQMTPAEKLAITAWIAAQAAFIPGLAQAIAGYNALPATTPEEVDAKKQAKKTLDDRLALWVASLALMYTRGYASAAGDTLVTWRWGITEEHCGSFGGRTGCSELHMQKHRLSWFTERNLIPRIPGSAYLGCSGFQCDCGLYKEDGSEIAFPGQRAHRSG